MSSKRLEDKEYRPREKIQTKWFIGKSQADIFNGFTREGWDRRDSGHIVFSKREFGHISFPRRMRINPAICALKFSQAGITRKEAMLILNIGSEDGRGENNTLL